MAQAQANDVQCVAITDHDTVDGIELVRQAAGPHGLEVIPGIELSAEVNNKEVHILGYFIDPGHAGLQQALRVFQAARQERVRRMIGKLRDLGVDGISFDEVCALTRSDAVGRPHLAAVLVEKGAARNIATAFNTYLAEGAPAYVKKYQLSPQGAMELIAAAGGVSVLAHPRITQVDELIPQFARAGLGGIEVYYPNTLEVAIRYYARLARKNGLIATGGSDAHGDIKPYTHIGKAAVPYEVVEELRARAAAGPPG